MWELDHKEGWRIYALELWCWERLLRVPWTTRRSNQSILKEINPEYTLEGLMLKLLCFDHLMWRDDSSEKTWCWKRLKAGGEGDDRGWDGWMASLTQQTWVWVNSGRWWRTGNPGVLQSTNTPESDTAEWLNNNSIHLIKCASGWEASLVSNNALIKLIF